MLHGFICLQYLFPIFSHEVMSIWYWSMFSVCLFCFLMQQKNGSYFHIHSLSLCILTGELRPLTMKDISNKSVFILVVCDCVCVYVGAVWMCLWVYVSVLLILPVWDYVFPEYSWVYLPSFGWSFPSNTFCRIEFTERFVTCLSYF